MERHYSFYIATQNTTQEKEGLIPHYSLSRGHEPHYGSCKQTKKINNSIAEFHLELKRAES